MSAETEGAMTRMESVVCAFVGAGLSNKEIGRELGIAESTVEAHVARARRKAGVTNRVVLALLAHGVDAGAALAKARAWAAAGDGGLS